MKVFIFDMDGVIIDSQPVHFDVDTRVLKHFGVNIGQEELEKYAGMGNEEIWSSLKEKYNMKETVTEILNYQVNKKLQVFKEMQAEPIEGIRDLLNKLYDINIPMAIASSSPRVLIEEVMNKFEISHYFKYIISGEEFHKSKPAPDIYLKTAQLMKVDPKDCVVLEDSKNGVMAAKAAGMKCIGYHNLNSGNQDLSKADMIVEAINEIIVENL